MDDSAPLTLSSILSAHALIKPHIHLTPLLTNTTLNTLASSPQNHPSSLNSTPLSHPKISLFFKCENLQRSGAFKIRGAFHALTRLLSFPTSARAVRTHGVITHSSGNHAQALALAAKELGVKATIVMPRISTPAKIKATQGYGARVVFSGSTAEEREAVVAEVMQEEREKAMRKEEGVEEDLGGPVLVPPYDATDIVLGQGTMGVEMGAQAAELMEREPKLSRHRKEKMQDGSGRLDAVIAPCGGGGMLSGLATAFAGTGTRVFGAEPSYMGADDCRRGLASVPPKRVEKVSSLTVADGVRTPVGEIPWGVISDREKVSGLFAVGEEEILKAMRLVWERMKVVIEPTAALGLAVVLYNEDFRGLVEREGGDEGWDVGVVFSGGNVDLDTAAGLLARAVGQRDVERAEGKVGMDGKRVAENVAG